jgi:hypothetical protein
MTEPFKTESRGGWATAEMFLGGLAPARTIDGCGALMPGQDSQLNQFDPCHKEKSRDCGTESALRNPAGDKASQPHSGHRS